MPRGIGVYDDARIQRRLWTPDALRGNGTVGWWNINQAEKTVGAHTSLGGSWLVALADQAGDNTITGSDADYFGRYQPNYWKSPERVMPALEMTSSIRQRFSTPIPYTTAGFSFHGSLMSVGLSSNTGTLVSGLAGSLDLRLKSGAVNVVRCYQAELAQTSFTLPDGPLMYGADVKPNFIRMQGNGRFEEAGTDGAFTQPVTTLGANAQGIDSQSGGESLNGGWSELVFKSPMMSRHEAWLVSGYLAWSNGLVYRLPASHPFKSRPPMIGD